MKPLLAPALLPPAPQSLADCGDSVIVFLFVFSGLMLCAGFVLGLTVGMRGERRRKKRDESDSVKGIDFSYREADALASPSGRRRRSLPPEVIDTIRRIRHEEAEE